MQQEAFFPFEGNVIDDFLIHFGTQGDAAEGLGLSAGEDGRAVGSRKVIHLSPDGTDIGGGPSVETDTFVEDHAAHGLFFHIVVIFSDQGFVHFGGLFPFTVSYRKFFLDFGKGIVTQMLVVDQGTGNLVYFVVGFFPDFGTKGFIVLFVTIGTFHHTNFSGQFILNQAMNFNIFVRNFDGFEHLCF